MKTLIAKRLPSIRLISNTISLRASPRDGCLVCPDSPSLNCPRPAYTEISGLRVTLTQSLVINDLQEFNNRKYPMEGFTEIDAIITHLNISPTEPITSPYLLPALISPLNLPPSLPYRTIKSFYHQHYYYEHTGKPRIIDLSLPTPNI